jgi:Zn-dependent protease with chaperone function
MKFRAKYYDGKTSKAHDAEVILEANHLKIVAEINDKTEVLVWDMGGIHKTDLGNGLKVVLKYGDFPYQYIEVEHPEFVSTLRAVYPRKQFEESLYGKVFTWGVGGLLLLAAVFLLLGGSIYFFALPWVAEKAALMVPVTYEKELGKAVKNGFVGNRDVNRKQTELLNAFFREMQLEASYPVNITVVNGPEVNAFALPGGEMVVFSEILRNMKSYESLAALLGHEYAHVHFRHPTRSLFKSLSGYLFISVLFNDVSGITAVLLENANALRNLNFSRAFEKQADFHALEILRSKKIDPNGMVELFSQLQQASGIDENYIPEFVSTHPLTRERIRYMKEEIAKGGFEVVENENLKKIFTELQQHYESSEVK